MHPAATEAKAAAMPDVCLPYAYPVLNRKFIYMTFSLWVLYYYNLFLCSNYIINRGIKSLIIIII